MNEEYERTPENVQKGKQRFDDLLAELQKLDKQELIRKYIRLDVAIEEQEGRSADDLYYTWHFREVIEPTWPAHPRP